MSLTVIVGPVKSGKSLELIARLAPYKFAEQTVALVQSAKNVRNKGITSRIGLELDARKVNSLEEVSDEFKVIGIDEFHMFSTSDIKHINQWLDKDKEIIMSGLDLDYRGKLMPFYISLLQVKPSIIIEKLAVCEVCRSYTAVYTQILQDGNTLTGGLPSIVPEDGTYEYQARCRKCFVSRNT